MADSPAKPRQRWLRFSLRTVFALVTVLACWLEWEFSTIGERRRLQARIEKTGGTVSIGQNGRGAPRVPELRIWLGDEPCSVIELPYSLFPESDVDKIKLTFPEASVRERTVWDGPESEWPAFESPAAQAGRP